MTVYEADTSRKVTSVEAIGQLQKAVVEISQELAKSQKQLKTVMALHERLLSHPDFKAWLDGITA